jgi:hypothetical protein
MTKWGAPSDKHCSKCGKRLTWKTCPMCKGRSIPRRGEGFLGKGRSFERKPSCVLCKGTGLALICPDWSAHRLTAKSREPPAEYCSICGKELAWKTCPRCKGRSIPGKGQSVPLRRSCDLCKGKGQALLCPGLDAHIASFARLKSRMSGTMQGTAVCPRCGGAAQYTTCPACGGMGGDNVQVPGQWTGADVRKNPFLPYSGAMPPSTSEYVRCGSCSGKGRIVICPNCRPGGRPLGRWGK